MVSFDLHLCRDNSEFYVNKGSELHVKLSIGTLKNKMKTVLDDTLLLDLMCILYTCPPYVVCVDTLDVKTSDVEAKQTNSENKMKLGDMNVIRVILKSQKQIISRNTEVRP